MKSIIVWDRLVRAVTMRGTVKDILAVYVRQCQMADRCGVAEYRPTILEVARRWANVDERWHSASDEEVVKLAIRVRTMNTT